MVIIDDWFLNDWNWIYWHNWIVIVEVSSIVIEYKNIFILKVVCQTLILLERCHLEQAGLLIISLLSRCWPRIGRCVNVSLGSTVTLQVYNPPGNQRSQQSHSVPGQDEDHRLLLYLDRWINLEWRDWQISTELT